MRRLGLIAASFLALQAMAPAALAWGPTGHRAVGVIADAYLTKKARREIEKVLGVETLAEASTWPDFMRASADPFWRQQAGPWHYVTVPDGKTYAEAGAPPEGDAVTALQRFAATLKDPKATKEEKALALRFTVHIIGDLHQPLHAGNGTDRGGNDVKVKWFGEPSNLHRVWDSDMIEGEDLSFTEWAGFIAPRIGRRETKEWAEPYPQVWIAESVAIRSRIYPASAELSWGYSFEHIATVRQRLAQAGVRTAAYLNALYAD